MSGNLRRLAKVGLATGVVAGGALLYNNSKPQVSYLSKLLIYTLECRLHFTSDWSRVAVSSYRHHEVDFTSCGHQC